MPVKDGERVLWSNNNDKWAKVWRVMKGGSKPISDAVEYTHLTEKQVRAIYIIQHRGEYKDIAAIEDIEQAGVQSRIELVRAARRRSQNTMRAFVSDYGNFEELKPYNQKPRSSTSNFPNVDGPDWELFVERGGLDEDFIDRLNRHTYLTPLQACVLRGFQTNAEPEQMAEWLEVSPPPSSPSLTPERTFLKRYIPKLRNLRRRSMNTNRFLSSDFDFAEFSYEYAPVEDDSES